MVNRRNVNSRKRRAAGAFFRQFLVGFLLLLAMILMGAGVWYGSRLEPLTIVTILVSGGDTIDYEEIKDIARKELEGSYYNFVPKRFSWTYPEEAIKQAVVEVEKVKSARLELVDGQTLSINVIEYDPAMLWCHDSLDKTNCMFVDEEGYAFTKAPPLVGTAMVRFYDNNPPTVGQKPFTYELVKDTNTFTKTIRQEFDLGTLSAEKVGPEEVTINLLGGGKIKLTLRQPIEDSIDNLRVLLESPQFSHLEAGNFEYIDLRFGDKVFVNEEAGQPDGEVSANGE